MKYKTNRILLFSLILNLLPYFLICQNKDEVFKSIKDKFNKMESISFTFESKDDKTNNGSLIADKTNKYKLVFQDKIIVCDGSTVWNYNKKEKQVLISKFKKNSNTSIQNIFFDISQNFSPSKIEKVKSEKNTLNNLLLTSNSSPLDKINLLLSNNLDIKLISYQYSGSLGNFKITKFKINPKINNSEFTFKTPKGVVELDLR